MTNKLTREQAEEICVELREGTIREKIAKGFGVSPALIQQINNGRSYRIYGMRYPIASTYGGKPIAKKRTPKEEYPIEDSYACNAYQQMN
jgi:hypothetical protein